MRSRGPGLRYPNTQRISLQCYYNQQMGSQGSLFLPFQCVLQPQRRQPVCLLVLLVCSCSKIPADWYFEVVFSYLHIVPGHDIQETCKFFSAHVVGMSWATPNREWTQHGPERATSNMFPRIHGTVRRFRMCLSCKCLFCCVTGTGHQFTGIGCLSYRRPF